ncbi:MAG: N-6 DNA methylase, partial [Myxococcales bacterium]|nr:N-6 DNA methylase [Myxococcales bacterium]
LADLQVFREFWALLACAQLLPDEPNHLAPLDQLLEDSGQVEKDITSALYEEYRHVRVRLFADLRAQHPERPAAQMLQLTQKLLDRVLFVAFAEDRGLLPARTLHEALLGGDGFASAWWRLKMVFDWVDRGEPKRHINAFNGGLFAPDPELDRLRPSNEVLQGLVQIAAYDFSQDVSVEVLGHIFEQSITDLEELRSSSSGEELEELSKRKKHGVFYTPSYVTRYLVDQTLGRTMRERFKALLEEHQPDRVRGSNKKAAAFAAVWRVYRDWLREVRIVDPACGSGAFLVAAFDHLLAEYERVNLALEELEGEGQTTLFDLTKTLLNRNLFGVDINAESIEITRLSLWLKTATPLHKLTWLDANIVAGDSLIDDPEASPVAFDWSVGRPAGAPALDGGAEADAQQIEAAWREGFDVVVGNPPYVRQELIGASKPHLEARFGEVWHGMADLFVYFFARGLEVLKPGGRLGFIVANKWLKAGYAEPLRRLLAEHAEIEQIIDFGHAPIFPDADAFPCIITLRKPTTPHTIDADHHLHATIFPREHLKDTPIDAFVLDHEVRIPQTSLHSAAWSLEPPAVRDLMARMRDVGTPLEDYAETKPYYGIKTGRNEAFIIDEYTRRKLITEDPRSAELIKRYLRGRDVERWSCSPSPDYMIFTRRGVNIDDYPAIRTHLEQFRELLEPKPDDHKGKWSGRKGGTYAWYEIQDSVDYWELLEQPKFVYQVIQFHCQYALDTNGLFANDKVFFIPNTDPWLLAVLNSPLMWWYNWRYLSHMKDEALNPAAVKMRNLPIPTPPTGTLDEIAALVAEVIAATLEGQEEVRALVDWLGTEHGVEKLGRKLEAPQTLDTETFVSEVKKRRSSVAGGLGVRALAKLRQEHSTLVEGALLRNAKLARAERRLSDLVLDAFGLTAAERDLVRRTQPLRTPYGLR